MLVVAPRQLQRRLERCVTRQRFARFRAQESGKVAIRRPLAPSSLTGIRGRLGAPLQLRRTVVGKASRHTLMDRENSRVPRVDHGPSSCFFTLVECASSRSLNSTSCGSAFSSAGPIERFARCRATWEGLESHRSKLSARWATSRDKLSLMDDGLPRHPGESK